MQRIIRKKPLLVIGLSLLFLAVFTEYLGLPVYHYWQTQTKPEAIQQTIYQKEKTINDFFEKIDTSHYRNLRENFGPYIKKARKKGIKLYIYQNRQLIFWSDNTTLPKLHPSKVDQLTVNHLGNGYYLQKTQYHDQLLFAALIPVKMDFSIQNEYLKNHITIGNELEAYFNIAINHKKGKPIYSQNGHYLFSLLKAKKTSPTDWPVWLFASAFLFLIFGFSRRLNIYFFQRKKGKAFTLFISIFLVVVLDMLFGQWPLSLFSQPLFNSSIFKAGSPISSLGNFFIVLVFLTILLHYIRKYFPLPIKRKAAKSFLIPLGFFVGTIVLAHFSAVIIRTLVLKSDINWDIKEFYDLTFLSLVGVVAIFLIFYNLVVLTSWAFNQVKNHLSYNLKFLLVSAILVILGYQLLTSFSALPNYFAGLFSLVLWTGFWVWQPQTPYAYGPLTFFVLSCSVFVAFHLIQFNQGKELNRKKQMATKVTYQRDVVAEQLFQNVSREIKNDKYVKNFFFNPILPKTFLTERIQKLYFSRYLNKYDLKIHTFKYGEVPYKSKSNKSLDYFQKLIDKYGLKTPGKNLNFINKTGATPTYLAIYDFNLLGGIKSTLVIELKKKVFHEESIYPELLLEKELKTKSQLQDYSHAIYKNNRLISQKGDYPYPVTTDINNKEKVFYQFEDGNYSHLFHKASHNTFVIISKEAPGSLHQLSVFSILFMAFFLLAMALIGIQRWNFHKIKSFSHIFEELKNGHFGLFRNLLFQHKIQFTILVMVLLVMVTVGISTVNYLRHDYNQKLNEDLSNKIRQILPVLEEKIQSKGTKFYNNKEKIYVTVKNLSNRFQADINVFDLNGFLITSSQPRVYNKNIQAKLMNAEAYSQMRINKQSQLIHNEKVGNLSYLAAYAPIRNAQNQIIGFLNLPYFSKESKLQNEISSLIITLVDLYVLIFLIVILVSLSISNTLTRPLELIREKLKKTQLGQANKPIEWESKDELGRLIKEYNEMIDALEENAQALAKSEREGAWREMARQVAHEIKNPLTPMKLNIQRLQGQFSDKNGPESEEVHRVSKILIQQIEHLSKIATDFSAFAQIELGEPTTIPVEKELSSIKEFFATNQNGVYFELNLNTKDSYIQLDKNHFNRILTNLLKNAREAIPDEQTGHITIGSQYSEKDKIKLWIKDNGSGIPDEKKEKIFQPNFSTKNSGTGLGLAMVKKMVEGAEGSIWFDSVNRKGTTFYMEFRLTQKPG